MALELGAFLATAKEPLDPHRTASEVSNRGECVGLSAGHLLPLQPTPGSSRL